MKRCLSKVIVYTAVVFLFFVVIQPVLAVSGWPECDYGNSTYNLWACREHAESFKDKRGPRGEQDESWYTWAVSAPYPLSGDTACGIAPQSLDCKKTTPTKKPPRSTPSCPANTVLLFNKKGDIRKNETLNLDGRVTFLSDKWEVESKDGVLLVESDESDQNRLEVTFPELVLLKTVLIYGEDSDKSGKKWSVNGKNLPVSHEDRWSDPYDLNIRVKKMTIDSDGEGMQLNICVRQEESLTPTSGFSPTPTLPSGGGGVSLKFDPTSQVKQIGDTFLVRVMVDTTTEESFGAEAHIEYDQNILRLTNIREGDFFPSVISTNNAGNSSVRGLVVEPADFRKGNGLLATLEFSALAAGETDVKFFCQPGIYNSSKVIKNDINASNIIDCGSNNSLHVQVGGGTTVSPTVSASPSRTVTPTPKVPKDRAKVLAALIIMIFILLIILMGI